MIFFQIAKHIRNHTRSKNGRRPQTCTASQAMSWGMHCTGGNTGGKRCFGGRYTGTEVNGWRWRRRLRATPRGWCCFRC